MNVSGAKGSNPSCEKEGFRPLKMMGQNFLRNPSIAARIASSVPDDALPHLVEIGPGKGILTEQLLKRGAILRAIELDRRLVSYLEGRFGRTFKGRFELMEGDAIKFLDGLLREETYIVSNLPFNISSKLFGGLLDRISFQDLDRTPFIGGLIMVQQEFGKRLLSGPGGRDYGKLSVNFASKMEGRRLFGVGKEDFDPMPKVDAWVIQFGPKRYEFRSPIDEILFKRVLDHSFSNRRKKLRNSLHPSHLGINTSLEELRAVLQGLRIEDSRPEELGPGRFMDLSDALSVLSQP